MKIEELLERVVKEGASDGFIAAEAPPSIKVDGQIYPISETALPRKRPGAGAVHHARGAEEGFLKHHECNYALATRSWVAFVPVPLCSAASAAW